MFACRILVVAGYSHCSCSYSFVLATRSKADSSSVYPMERKFAWRAANSFFKFPSNFFHSRKIFLFTCRKKFLLPWSQRFFLIFLRKRDQQQAAKPRQRVAKATRRERKTSGYLGLESHFHADDRVRIWPSGVDWLIFFQTRKPIWLACLIVTTEGTLRIFTPHFWR